MNNDPPMAVRALKARNLCECNHRGEAVVVPGHAQGTNTASDLIVGLHKKFEPFIEQGAALWHAYFVAPNTGNNLFFYYEDFILVFLDISRVHGSSHFL